MRTVITAFILVALTAAGCFGTSSYKVEVADGKNSIEVQRTIFPLYAEKRTVIRPHAMLDDCINKRTERNTQNDCAYNDAQEYCTSLGYTSVYAGYYYGNTLYQQGWAFTSPYGGGSMGAGAFGGAANGYCITSGEAKMRLNMLQDERRRENEQHDRRMKLLDVQIKQQSNDDAEEQMDDPPPSAPDFTTAASTAERETP